MAKPATLIRQYKHHSSDFASWEQKGHAQHWLVFPENMGANLAIDEVSLSNGQLWTFLTNKAGKGRKDTLVAAIRGTRTTDIEQARASGITYNITSGFKNF
jgi:transposase